MMRISILLTTLLAATLSISAHAQTAETPAPAAPTSSKTISHWLCGEKSVPLLFVSDANIGLVQMGEESLGLVNTPEAPNRFAATDGSDSSITFDGQTATFVFKSNQAKCSLVEPQPSK